MLGGAIQINGLHKRYGDVHAVRGIDIAVGAGETVALLGPNGAGKSTTIDTILGLAEPDEGEVSVFGGAPVAAIDAGYVGAMLQTGAVLRDLSVRELVAMVASLYPEPLAVEDALALTGLSEVAERRGEAVVLSCADSDAAIRALLAAHPDARDIEIAAAGLEQAFLELTAEATA